MGEIKQRKTKNKPNDQKNEKRVSKKGKSSPGNDLICQPLWNCQQWAIAKGGS